MLFYCHVYQQVTDKIRRSLTLEVARTQCEGELCSLSCRVDLISQDGVDEVTWHNCLDFPDVNDIIRDKRGAIGGFKQVTIILLLIFFNSKFSL